MSSALPFGIRVILLNPLLSPWSLVDGLRQSPSTRESLHEPVERRGTDHHINCAQWAVGYSGYYFAEIDCDQLRIELTDEYVQQVPWL